MSGTARTPDTCPRCGGRFRCGAADAAPCACTAVRLDAATLVRLRVEFDGCLCLNCLHELERAQRRTPGREPGA